MRTKLSDLSIMSSEDFSSYYTSCFTLHEDKVVRIGNAASRSVEIVTINPDGRSNEEVRIVPRAGGFNDLVDFSYPSLGYRCLDGTWLAYLSRIPARYKRGLCDHNLSVNVDPSVHSITSETLPDPSINRWLYSVFITEYTPYLQALREFAEGKRLCAALSSSWGVMVNTSSPEVADRWPLEIKYREKHAAYANLEGGIHSSEDGEPTIEFLTGLYVEKETNVDA